MFPQEFSSLLQFLGSSIAREKGNSLSISKKNWTAKLVTDLANTQVSKEKYLINYNSYLIQMF